MDVRRLALLFGRSTCLFLSATLIASVSMLSADEASWSFSRNIFYRVFAPTYPGPQDRSATVVLLNDASFQAFDTYPVKYQTHATILRALATYSPRAVFVDFAFIDDRPDQTIDDLKSVLEEYYNRHIPIYFPVHKVSNSPNDKGIRPDLAELANAGRINLVSFELGRTLWDSPLYSLYSKREGRPTIGAQIMKDFYSQLYSTNIAGKSEFEIWWGLPPAQINCDRVGDPCGWRYNIFGRLLDAINLKFMPLDWEIGADPVRIPYSPLIYVDDLLNGNKRDTITPALTSKFVFYGPDIDVARDDFANPVFSFRSEDTVLPGIFFHAMALENMIDLRQHIKTPRQAGLMLMWFRDVWAIGIVCFVLFLF